MNDGDPAIQPVSYFSIYLLKDAAYSLSSAECSADALLPPELWPMRDRQTHPQQPPAAKDFRVRRDRRDGPWEPAVEGHV